MVKVRFAPSPTGYLHIGGARTALFNYLFAKANNGKFVLRIEDTDKERSTEDSVKVILDSLKWIGLNWDEGPEVGGENGPYFQSQRGDIYKKYIDKLMTEGKAYKCFCKKEELTAEREKAQAEKRAFRYAGTCRNLTEDDIKAKGYDTGSAPFTIRIKAEETGETVVHDLVRGDVRFQNEVLDDFIIARTDGGPMYNFVVTIDDALMGITHVIRGEDHLSNSPKQIQLYKALGFTIPKFAHIPLILGPDKSRLSKRHGATSVGDYEKKGILPSAFINALALLGWSFDDKTDEFTLDELIEKFTLEKVSKSGAMFDNTRMEYFNGLYIRKMKLKDLVLMCKPYFEEAGLIDSKTDDGLVKKVIGLQQEKIRTFKESADISEYFFKDFDEMSEKAQTTWAKNEDVRQAVLKVFRDFIAQDDCWKPTAVFNKKKECDSNSVEEKLKAVMELSGIKPKSYMHVIRVVLTGQISGPGLFDVMETLGQETCLRRIDKYRD